MLQCSPPTPMAPPQPRACPRPAGGAAPVTSIAPRSPNTQVFTGPNGTDIQVGQHARGIAPAPSTSVQVQRD